MFIRSDPFLPDQCPGVTTGPVGRPLAHSVIGESMPQLGLCCGVGDVLGRPVRPGDTDSVIVSPLCALHGETLTTSPDGCLLPTASVVVTRKPWRCSVWVTGSTCRPRSF